MKLNEMNFLWTSRSPRFRSRPAIWWPTATPVFRWRIRSVAGVSWRDGEPLLNRAAWNGSNKLLEIKPPCCFSRCSRKQDCSRSAETNAWLWSPDGKCVEIAAFDPPNISCKKTKQVGENRSEGSEQSFSEETPSLISPHFLTFYPSICFKLLLMMQQLSLLLISVNYPSAELGSN